MKRIILIIVLTMVLFPLFSFTSEAETGHPSFQRIVIPSISKAKLLVSMSDEEKEKALDQVKRRFFGWNVITMVEDQNVEYIGETVFSRANKTSLPIKFKYQATESKMIERSVSTNSSVGLKLSGKILGFNAGMDAAIKKEVGTKERIERIEKYEFSITVYPKTKITVNVRGEARLNNGASKYYFLGITFKKGTWETIDVINAYYEFYEERI